ncbi:MAG: transglutaminase domain-containing protein [Clostridia bacterium]|nr:transglutaminase domain-containing protein [Clostridia bacterium]
MNHYMEYLAVPLPEDIQRFKFFGDQKLLNDAIDRRIAAGVPDPLKKRLQLEKDVMARWVEEFIHDEEEALQICMDQIEGFTREELHELRMNNAVEWAYINGKVMYKECFVNNLFVTRKQYLDRCKDLARREESASDKKNLKDTLTYMKKHGGMKARIHLRLSTKVNPPEERKGEKVVCQLPLPVEYAQVKNVNILRVSHDDAVIAPKDFPARTVRFEAVPDQLFEVEYTYETHVDYMQPDPDKVSAQQPNFYTEEQLPHIQFTPFVKMMTKEIVGDETNPLIKAKKIYEFVTTKNIYSFMREYMTLPSTIPEYFMAGQKGDCGVHAITFITLCRCAGIPARWQSGFWSCPWDIGMHDWAQFYVAPYGWLFCDPSFGGSAHRDGDREKWEFYFCNLDPYRMPGASEFMQSFYIPMKQYRHDPYDNQSCECEYHDARVNRNDITSKREVVSIEILED